MVSRSNFRLRRPPNTPHLPTAPSSTDPTAIAHLVLTSTDPKNLTQILHCPSIQWTPHLVNSTLKRLWDDGPKALHFFTVLSRHPSYAHHPSSFDHAVDLSARLRDSRATWAVLSRMRPTRRTFAILAERYASSGKPHRALRLFLSMHHHGCFQDLSSFNTLLDVLCKSGRVEMASNLFRALRGRFKPDRVTYNVLANGWCLVKKVPRALEVFREMLERGFPPDLTSYNIVLKGYFRVGQVDEAWRFFLEMKRRECNVDVVTYTTLVHGFGVLGEIKRARRVFDRMAEEGVLPSVATYNAMIQVLCKKDCLENALLVFEDMLKKGYVPNVMTYNLVIRGLCHAGKMAGAMEFIGKMKEEGCEPNVQTYNVVIRHFCDLGEIERGLNLFERMEVEVCLPNLDTYNILISGMFLRKKPEDLVVAGKLLIEMVDRGFLPRKFTFNRVLNGLLLTVVTWHRLQKLFSRMEPLDIDLSVAYWCIVRCHWSRPGNICSAAVLQHLSSRVQQTGFG